MKVEKTIIVTIAGNKYFKRNNLRTDPKKILFHNLISKKMEHAKSILLVKIQLQSPSKLFLKKPTFQVYKLFNIFNIILYYHFHFVKMKKINEKKYR